MALLSCCYPPFESTPWMVRWSTSCLFSVLLFLWFTSSGVWPVLCVIVWQSLVLLLWTAWCISYPISSPFPVVLIVGFSLCSPFLPIKPPSLCRIPLLGGGMYFVAKHLKDHCCRIHQLVGLGEVTVGIVRNVAHTSSSRLSESTLLSLGNWL